MTKSIASVLRAIKLLDVLAKTKTPMRVKDIVACSDLSKSTTIRQLQTLVESECIVRRSDGRYQLGHKVLGWGQAYKEGVEPYDLIMPVMKRLRDTCKEGVSFFIQEGDKRICLYRLDSLHELRDHIRPGEELPLKVGAAGRILLDTSMQNTMVIQVYESREEREHGIAAIAAPVLDSEKVVGALAISGPLLRFTDDKVALWTDNLLIEAVKLSKKLGYNNS